MAKSISGHEAKDHRQTVTHV